ncbi:MAG: type II toxin-antitoxin system RelE/ParE family toxin [Nitrospinae bacterium]|nr:type II toxin-antitoxin system RelE/ParE family toxin [Nitrospinota bacterium]
MNRVFVTRHFARWISKTDLPRKALLKAVCEMQAGMIDAGLGGGLVKKRVALPGRGKRGGARTIVATNKDDRWIFIFGFSKNERDNISESELEAFKMIASDLMRMSIMELDLAKNSGILEELIDET